MWIGHDDQRNFRGQESAAKAAEHGTGHLAPAVVIAIP
jgi:hypothetical protein